MFTSTKSLKQNQLRFQAFFFHKYALCCKFVRPLLTSKEIEDCKIHFRGINIK